MPDVSCDVTSTSVDPAVDGEGPADAGAHGDEQHGLSGSGGIGGELTDQVGVDVVVDGHREVEPSREPVGDAGARPARDGSGGGDDASADRIDRTGGAHSHRVDRTDPIHETGHEVGDQGEHGVRPFGGRGDGDLAAEDPII